MTARDQGVSSGVSKRVTLASVRAPLRFASARFSLSVAPCEAPLKATTPATHGASNSFVLLEAYLLRSPWVVLNDFGGAFAMGAVGGAIWHGIKGARNSPRVRVLSMTEARLLITGRRVNVL